MKTTNREYAENINKQLKELDLLEYKITKRTVSKHRLGKKHASIRVKTALLEIENYFN